MATLLRHHILIPTAKGVGNNGLDTILASLLWAWRIETHDWRQLAPVLLRVFSMTTDFGTESMIVSVPSLGPNPIWSHWQECDIVDEDGYEGDGDEGEVLLPQPQQRLFVELR